MRGLRPSSLESYESIQRVHVSPLLGSRPVTAIDTDDIEAFSLSEGKSITVTVAEEQELLSPQQAAEHLGFSRQHVVRLINAGEIKARKLPSSSYWQIPLGSMLDFEQRREHARELSDIRGGSLTASRAQSKNDCACAS